MKIQLNTNLVPIFSGTYETDWNIQDHDDDGNELNTVYDHKDLMRGIVEEYHNHEDKIKTALNCDFITSIKFDGFYSPHEYNFNTDTLDFTIEVNKKKMIQALNKLENSEEFSQFLYDHYTSYDGFMSFTPNNFEGIKDQIMNEGREFDQSVGALIRFLAGEEVGIYMERIEYMVHDDWQSNGYGDTEYHVECWKCEELLKYPFEHECKSE